jgi:type IV pilus assembly protein PilC
MAESGALTNLLNKPIFEHISKRDVATFSLQLSLLLDSGMPLLRGMRVLASRTSNTRFAEIIDDIADNVEQGNTFANSLAKYPSLFSDVYVNIVRVGEVAGALEQSLRRLAELTDRELRYRSKLLYAMAYPIVVCTAVVLLVVAMLVYVFPVFMEVFEGKEDQLPWLTKALAGGGDFITAWWHVLLIILIALIALFLWFRSTPFGRRVLDRIKLRISLPIFGRLGEKAAVARVCEVFSLLLKSGIQMIPAMRITASASGNVIVEERFTVVADRVEEGKSFQEELMTQEIFPPLVVDMMGVGEESGSLDSVLDRLQEAYSTEVDMALENVNRILEPILIVGLGGMALLIALAVYLPYWSLGVVLG